MLYSKISKEKLVTFIVPSLARPTLKRTLWSIKNQNCDVWKAIVNFDGIDDCEKYCKDNDNNIKYYCNEKVRKYGASIRNNAIKKADTEWVAFVDDDDIIYNNYIDCMKEEIENDTKVDCIIFRMKKRSRIIPPMKIKQPKEIKLGNVGISFCCRKKIFEKNFSFKPSSAEDYYFIESIREKFNVKLSDYCTYEVRPENRS